MVVDVDLERPTLRERFLDGVHEEVDPDEVHPLVLLDTYVQMVLGHCRNPTAEEHHSHEPILHHREETRQELFVGGEWVLRSDDFHVREHPLELGSELLEHIPV